MERTRTKWDWGLGRVGRGALLCGALVLGAAEARAAEKALLLGVDRDGKQESAWIDAVSEHLAHNGENLVLKEHLTAKDRACKGPECLDALAAREQASLVLSLSVQSNAPGTYVISGTLYDVAHHLPYQPSRPDVCDCSADQLVSHLGQMADDLFKDYRKRLATSTVASVPSPLPGTTLVTPQPSGLTNPPAVPENKQPLVSNHPLSTKRKVIAGVLGGLAGISLITSIYLTTLDNTPRIGSTCSYMDGPMEPRCYWDTRAGYGIGYGLTGGLLIGMGVALFLPEHTPIPPIPTTLPIAAKVSF